VAFLQPGDVVDDGGGSGLDAAVFVIGLRWGRLSTVSSRLILVFLKSVAFCSATKTSTSSRSEP
jgi:hypothetical protein